MPRTAKPKLLEYKNVTNGTNDAHMMWLEVYGENEIKEVIKLMPGETVFLSEKDIRNHRNDKRFIRGQIVPVDSSADVQATREIEDIVSDERIEWFIKNTEDVTTLKEKIKILKNSGTVARILKEAKKPENNKAYAFVVAIEEKLQELVNLQDKAYYGNEDKKDKK